MMTEWKVTLNGATHGNLKCVAVELVWSQLDFKSIPNRTLWRERERSCRHQLRARDSRSCPQPRHQQVRRRAL